jgi:hypothetical protein
MQIFHRSRIAGTWPNGEPQSVRDASDRSAGLHAYEVHMVVLGGYEAYEVIAVCADRETARQHACVYNEGFVFDDTCIEDYARVEEISFYPAGVIPEPYSS